MAQSVRTETIRVASRLAGGPRKLAALLSSPLADVMDWIAGTKEPPEAAFLRALAIVLDELDAEGP
jgi:hypothetical protein